MCLLMTKQQAENEIILETTEVFLGGVPVKSSKRRRFIVDTGSNVTIVHVPNAVDKYRGRGKQKTITFHNKTHPYHKAIDLSVRIKTGENNNNNNFCLKGYASVLDIYKAIPRFPSNQMGIIGTNLLEGRMIKVCEGGRVCIVKKNSKLNGFFELEGVVGCDKYSDHVGLGPLLTVKVEKNLFLVDTGNLRSTFCIKRKRPGIRERGQRCIAKLSLKNNPQRTFQVMGDYLGWEPISLVTIKCPGKRSPNGNLGIDVWAGGVFRETVFDFGSTVQMDGRPVYRIFCRPY